MFTWLKKILGTDIPDTPEIAKPAAIKAPAKKATSTKAKATTKKPASTASKKRGRPKKTAE